MTNERAGVSIRQSFLNSTALVSLFLVATISLFGPVLPLPAAARETVQCDVAPAPERFEPEVPRSEIEQDRLEAYALFATARTLSQRAEQDRDRRRVRSYDTQALRDYQRALRRDPRYLPMVWQIVLLAEKLGRLDEAARYAVIGARRDPSDHVLLPRLARYLTEQGKLAQALALYELLLAAPAATSGPMPLVTQLPIRLEMGRLYFLTDRFAKASAAFAAVQDALARPETDAEHGALRSVLLENARLTYLLFAEAHLKAGQLDRAQVALGRAAEAGVPADRLTVRRARMALKRGAPQAAIDLLQAYFDKRLTGEGTLPYELLADALTRLDQQDAITARLESLRDHDPDNVPLASVLAARYLQQDSPAKAAELFSHILKETSAASPPRTPIRVLRGLCTIHRRRGDAAAILSLLVVCVHQTSSISALGEEADKLARDVALLDRVAAIAADQQSDPPGPIERFRHVAVAQWALRAARYDLAETCYRRAQAVDSEAAPAWLVEWGFDLLQAGQYARAAAVFAGGLQHDIGPQKGAARDAFRAGLLFYLAGALELTGETDEAIGAARQAVALESDRVDIARRVAWIQYHARRFDTARESYQELIGRFDARSLAADSRESLRQARFDLSHLCLLDQDAAAAEEWLEQVLDEFPEDVGALNDLAYLWIDQDKHLQRSLQMVQTAVATEPDNRAYRDTLGWAYYRLGRYDEAVRELETAAAGDLPDEVILNHLGDAYDKTGRTVEARQVRARALELESADE